MQESVSLRLGSLNSDCAFRSAQMLSILVFNGCQHRITAYTSAPAAPGKPSTTATKDATLSDNSHFFSTSC